MSVPPEALAEQEALRYALLSIIGVLLVGSVLLFAMTAKAGRSTEA